jgi:hypothetical protein
MLSTLSEKVDPKHSALTWSTCKTIFVPTAAQCIAKAAT